MPRFDGCEDTHTEFKQEWCPSLLRAAAAFANTEGGIIYLGIQDNGIIIGVPNEQLDAVQRQCASAIRDTLGFNPKVEVVDFNARKCVVIIVAPSVRLVPYKEGKNSTSNFYLRVGAKTHKMNEDDLSSWGRNRHLFINKWEKRIEEKVASLIQLSLNSARETQPPTATLAQEPRLTRLDKEGEPALAPVSPTPPNFNQLKLPMFANLEKLNSVDFHIWQAVDRSRDQAITIEKNILAGARALKAFSLGYSPLHNPDPMFNELSDADDVVTIDWQRLQYKPLVIDRALTRLCKAGVLERGEWQGSRRVYPLLIPYDAPDKPSV